MRNYYDLLNVRPSATPVEVRASFRRLAARYRATIPITNVFADSRFRGYLNAYLTLTGKERAAYDAGVKAAPPETPPRPEPLEALPLVQRRVLMAQIAYWRRENVEAIHLLRELLEKEPGHAPGWALLGEIYFSVDRLEEGIRAYERAVQAGADNAAYGARLGEARAALAGTGELAVELSPEEELLREERRRRWRITTVLLLLGLAAVFFALLTPLRPVPDALHIPWGTVGKQMLAAFLLLLGLSYGRLIMPFERELVWSTIAAGDRGTIRRYPYGLILFAASFASLWLAIAALLVSAFMDEDWPLSPSIMLGLCALLNVALCAILHANGHGWGTTFAFGGNLLAYAAMLGWWVGSFSSNQYE